MGEASRKSDETPSEGDGPLLTQCRVMNVHNVIKEAVKDGGWMDTGSLKLAIEKLRTENPCAENSKSSNPSCCKHYANPLQLHAVNSVDGKYQSLETTSPCHNAKCEVLCIPVMHDEQTDGEICAGRWSLYAFHLSRREVSILDPLRSGAHQSIWPLICEALNKCDRFKNKSFDKWKVDTIFNSEHRQSNGNDCGFYVFNFMRRWDCNQLDRSWEPPESKELRKEFLEYMLPPDDQEHVRVHHSDPAYKKRMAPQARDKLYDYTTDFSESKEEVWVSSTYPTQISLDVKSIQNMLNLSGCMDTKSLNLAIRKMAMMGSNDGNLDNSNHLGYKHYVSADFARYAISEEDEHTNMETCILHDFVDHHSASNPQVLCIPVMHEGHWTLYAFNMDDEKVSILDPSLNRKRHKSIRLKICKALERAKAKSYLFKKKSRNFSCWKYEFAKVYLNEKSRDSGFIVFNYMRWWNGVKLDESKMPVVTDSINLRKEFLEYILCFKDNQAYQQPPSLSKLIEDLPSAPAWTRCLMDHELLKVLIEGNAEKFVGVPEMTRIKLFRGITTDGEGVLHIAARIGDMQLVKAIFDKFEVGNLLPNSAKALVIPPLEKNSTEADGKPLVICIDQQKKNDIDCVEKTKIIEFADYLMTRNYRGETCLHEAIRWDRKEVVTSLISVNQQVCKDDRTRPSLLKIVDYGGVSPLYLATMLRRTDIVLSLTKKDDHDVRASYAGPGGKTALHAAILMKNKKLIKQLLEWNPELKSVQDKCGSTPLHLLASVKGLDVTELLPGSHSDQSHSNGPCDFLKKDSNGMLPIHVAASNGRLEIVERLLKACHHCMCFRNASGQSFLHVAVENKCLGVVRHVCKEQTLHGILNLQDQDGNTALHLAVKRGYQLIFCFLMSNPGVCLNLANKEGHTPRDLATLAINSQLKLLQNSRVLISLHLRLAGAKFGTCRKDEHMAAKLDKENLSDKMTKFAGPMAVCAIFMLNISVAAFFSIAKSYLPSADPNAPAPMDAAGAVSKSKSNAARAFKALIISDTIAFSSAALSAFCSTFAALSVIDRPTRLLCLRIGGSAFQIASMAVVAVFVLSVYLAFGPVDSVLPTVAGVLGLVALSPQCIPLFFMILHAWTLIYRFMLLDDILRYFVLRTQTILQKLPPRVGNSLVSICVIVLQVLGCVFAILWECLVQLAKLICCIPLLIGLLVVAVIVVVVFLFSPLSEV